MAKAPTFKKSLNNYRGRLNRKGYFWYSLFNLVLYLLSVFVCMMPLMLMPELQGSGLDVFFAIPVLILTFVFTYTGLSMTIARLHDLNKSFWWFFIALIPYVDFVFYLYLTFARSYPLPNKWGDPIDGTVKGLARKPQPQPQTDYEEELMARMNSQKPAPNRTDYTQL